MGTSQQAVKGSGAKNDGNNLVHLSKTMKDGVEKCIETKREDLINEGKSARKENERKIELLENVRNMMTVVQDLLEGY